MSLPRDPERDLERLLDHDGGDLGALYRRLPRSEPPRRLDRSVLGEAARAVHGYTPRRHRWIVGFGSAAGIVLAAGVAWQVGQKALQQPNDGFRSSPIVVPVEPITESSLRKRERATAAQKAAATAAPAAEMEAAAAPPPVPAPAKPNLARKPKPAIAADAAKELSPPAPAAAPPAPQAVPFPAQVERTESAAPGAAATGTFAPNDEELNTRQASGGDRLDQAASNRARSPALSAPSESVELRRDMQLSPHNWLAHIKQLLQQGRQQQAADSLRMFRRVHPDLPVPSELRALED
ncbi:MAG: hypothetical protein ABIW82_18145 [Dokdonella sp.]